MKTCSFLKSRSSFPLKSYHSRKMIVKTWFQSNLTVEKNSGFRASSSRKMKNWNRQEIDFEDMKNRQKIDFLTQSLLQYKTWSFKKNDSKNMVSIQPDFEEKILDFGLDLRKKVFGKSTGNRFWGYEKSTRNRFLLIMLGQYQTIRKSTLRDWSPLKYYSFEKNASEISVSIQGTGREKIQISSSELWRKNEKMKSTGNRFRG